MKPGSKNRPTLNTRRSKSLCGRFETQGIKEVVERKSLFRTPHAVVNIRKNNLNPSRGIPKPVKNGLSNSRPSHVFKGVNNKQSQSQAKSKFLRPEIDVLAARKRMLQRTLNLKKNTENEVEDKNLSIKDFNITQKLNLTCTPKQSALTKVYLKLSESAQKSAKARTLFSAVSSSPSSPPFKEDEIFHGKSVLNSTLTVNNSFDLKNKVDSSKPGIPCNSEIDKSKGNLIVTSVSKEEISVPDFSVREIRKNIDNQSSSNCALNNILKHCQLYSSKISSIIDAVTSLDDSFQSVIVGEIGGHVYSNFCEYQKKKLKLYRDMKMLEEELEDSVRNEINVQSKFQDYLRKKANVWKEESELLEEFKGTVKCIINKYEEEVAKPPENNSLHELVQMLSSSTIFKKKVGNDKPVLRRSQRLLTPKQSQANDKNCRVLRSNSGKKNVKGSDDLIIKRNTKSNDKRCIQRSIYKDLQKSFNLYSPECSF